MSDLAWSGIIAMGQGQHLSKPRDRGLTMLIDTGLGVAASTDLVEIGGDYIDHWKCSFGTSSFVRADVLMRKLSMLNAHGILTYPGGTLLEAAIVNRTHRAYIARAKLLGFGAIEVSDGTIDLDRETREEVIAAALDAGFTVIAEVGKKDPDAQPSVAEIADQALLDLEAGASFVIVEGRESGASVGIYDEKGGIKGQTLFAITEMMGDAADRLIWEAPRKDQQATLVKAFGANVNLGNVEPGAILALESLRAGLRFETMKAVAEAWKERARLRHAAAPTATIADDEPGRQMG